MILPFNVLIFIFVVDECLENTYISKPSNKLTIWYTKYIRQSATLLSLSSGRSSELRLEKNNRFIEYKEKKTGWISLLATANQNTLLKELVMWRFRFQPLKWWLVNSLVMRVSVFVPAQKLWVRSLAMTVLHAIPSRWNFRYKLHNFL